MNFPNKKLKRIALTEGTPTFVYSEIVLKTNMARISDTIHKHDLANRVELYVAYFCNSNPHLFEIVTRESVGILLQTHEEYVQIKSRGLSANIIVSPSVLSNQEIDFWVKENVPVNLSSLEEVKYFIKNHRNKPLSFRIDLTEKGDQRTGIKTYQLKELMNLLRKEKVPAHSFHVYVGTGSSCRKVLRNSEKAFRIFNHYFPETKKINLGGGFGFHYAASATSPQHFPWNIYFEGIKKQLLKYKIPEGVKILLEPGRDIFADAGLLLLSVKRVITHHGGIKVATDGSYVHVPSSTVRKRQHRTRFFTKGFRAKKPNGGMGFLSGCTTLSSDYVFPGPLIVPKSISDGDFITIEDMGAYAATQHMEFLNKKPCAEVLIRSNNEIVRITRRGDDDDKLRYLLNKPKKL